MLSLLVCQDAMYFGKLPFGAAVPTEAFMDVVHKLVFFDSFKLFKPRLQIRCLIISLLQRLVTGR
jgi:hypothetical protein